MEPESELAVTPETTTCSVDKAPKAKKPKRQRTNPPITLVARHVLREKPTLSRKAIVRISSCVQMLSDDVLLEVKRASSGKIVKRHDVVTALRNPAQRYLTSLASHVTFFDGSPKHGRLSREVAAQMAILLKKRRSKSA